MRIKWRLLLIGLAIFLVFLIFSRFYHVGYTARFTEDESGFLVRLHQIALERKVTLVGQINEQGTKVFGSLSIYLLLPFAILGGFTPTSVFYGAAFWGVITALALLYLIFKVNIKMAFLSAILIIIWFPLVQTGRWAWNPNLIPLWVALGLVCYFLAQGNVRYKSLVYFMSGIFFGLAIHQHYYAVFGTGIFIAIIAIESLIKRDFKNLLLPGVGFIAMLLPFVVFDLRHPPGIFILGASKQAHVTSLSQIVGNIVNFGGQVLRYYAGSQFLTFVLLFLLTLLVIFDVVKRNKALIFLLPSIFQICVISVLGLYFPHYFFVIIPFFLVYIIYPRKIIGRITSYFILIVLIIGSLGSFIPAITKAPVDPNLPTVEKITTVLKNQIKSGDLKNVNIVTLASPDHNTEGRKYRDLLLVPDNLQIKSTGEYSITDNLFVVSTSSISVVRNDPAVEISNFRNGKLRGTWQIEGSNWVVYLLNKN